MTCDACGREVPSDARFCPHCGTAVAAQAGATAPATDLERPVDPADAAEPTVASVATDPADASEPTEPTVADADPDADPAADPAPADDSGRSKPTVLTVLGNLLAVAAGGTLGVLAGMAIRQVM
ncbi:MAG: zinc-ribbon domain-containing protein [Egibacteraceae bacterium]